MPRTNLLSRCASSLSPATSDAASAFRMCAQLTIASARPYETRVAALASFGSRNPAPSTTAMNSQFDIAPARATAESRPPWPPTATLTRYDATDGRRTERSLMAQRGLRQMSAVSPSPDAPCSAPARPRSLPNGLSHGQAHTLCRQGLNISWRETALDSWQPTAATKPSERQIRYLHCQ